jgi:hypothetical protein
VSDRASERKFTSKVINKSSRIKEYLVMRINELLSENQVDEISLGGIGRGIEKGLGGLAKGVGYVAGIPGGLAQKYQQGKARATAGIGGTLAEPPKQPNPAFTQALQNYQQYGTANAPAGAVQDPKVMRQQANQLRKQANDLEKQAQDVQKQTQQAQQQAQQAQQQAQQQTAPAGQPATQVAPTAGQPQPTTAAPSAPTGGGFTKAVGDIARGAGAVSRAPAGFVQGVKQAWQQGRDSGYGDQVAQNISGQPPTAAPSAPVEPTMAPNLRVEPGGKQSQADRIKANIAATKAGNAASGFSGSAAAKEGIQFESKFLGMMI